ncbi:LysR family transcriptional regulator [Candidimonas humi]|jgi:DNA-binding transcriptional LysR family regulator|uniref:LysR family transcriptional regulator n=1 Tax=Candidimonas humi TaxID=683355 RepID=A0ABV8NQU7_9BURK|nr:LysR family transcriptional regulator [Candidimonas humi]MBV6303778.1 LysR family transcriptional regulator [Candidimonas humi]
MPVPPLHHLRFKQLELLCGVAEGNSFRMLAEKMSLTQPAISKMAREMEAAIQAPLFVRNREGVTLTPMGRSLVQQARMILTQLERMSSNVEQYRGGKEHVLRLGSPSYTAVALLAAPIAQLVATHSAARVEMVDAVADTLFAQLKNGELDFVVGSLPVRPMSDEDAALLHTEILYPDQLSFITQSSRKPLPGLMTLKDLQEYSWVLPARDSLVRHALRSAMRDAGLPIPRAAIEVGSIPTIGALVGQQPRLLGVVRADAAHYFSRGAGISMINIHPRIALPPVAIVRLKDNEPTDLTRALFELIRAQSRTLLSHAAKK